MKVAVIVEIACLGGEIPVQTHQVASSIGASQAYVEKVCAELRRRGLIKGFIGRGGGHMLARPAADIFMADIIDSVRTSGTGKKYSGSEARAAANTLCLWEQSENLLIQVFQHVSLADILHCDLQAHPFLKILRDACNQALTERSSEN